MKKWIFIGVLFLEITPFLQAQPSYHSSQSNTLAEQVKQLKQKVEWLNVYLNMQGSFDIYLNDNPNEKTAFKMNQLRLEVKGNVTDKIYYRYRQRLNRNNSAQTLDNLPASIDYAAIGFQVTDYLSILAGKQCTAFGGFEFDLNPIEVYQYCDMLDYMSNFLTGVDFIWQIHSNHELHFQIVDSRNGSFSDFFGKVPEGIKAAKSPLGYTINWNGNLFENKLKTRWSASMFQDAKDKNWYYYALGTELNLPKFVAFFDFMYSREDIDRTGIISQIAMTDGYDTRALDARYMSMILHLTYRLSPYFRVWAKGTRETSRVKDANGELEKGKYRTSWGYMGGIEYYPQKDNNLHFFLNYIGQSFDYTDRAKVFGVSNSNPQRISLGLVYQLPIF